jgi:GTP-binding protein
MARTKQTDLPLVAIVGRPNVGKSTLFNRLIGERRSIVGDEPGITRDRIYGEAEWNDLRFALVDTGGIVPDDEAVIPANILKQASFAIDDAEALIWVVDARKGVTPLDEELARLLRETGKRVIVAANKADAAHLESDAGEFHEFGFDEVSRFRPSMGMASARCWMLWSAKSPTLVQRRRPARVLLNPDNSGQLCGRSIWRLSGGRM